MRIPFLPALLLVVFSILIDLYIYGDIRRYCRERLRNKLSLAYIIISAVLWILIIVAFSIPKNSEDASILPLMWILFTYLSIYIPKFIYTLFSLIGKLFSLKKKSQWPIADKIGFLFGLLIFVVMWIGILFTRQSVEVNRVEISSNKLPKSFDGFKVAQFSDLHLGTWGNDTTFVSKLVDSVNNLKPDLIVFTGDFVNRKASEMLPFVNTLSRLKAPNGVIAILGNHDYGGYVKWDSKEAYNNNLVLLDSLIRKMNWKLLANKTNFIKNGNDSIVIIGVENWGEPPFNQLGDLGKSYPENPQKLQGLNDDMFKILLTHNPEHWNQVVTKNSNINLSLSGHTHAMQMMIKLGDYKWSPSAWKYSHWGGLYTDKAKDGTPMNLYVNIGAGEVGFPARIGAAKPEVTEFTLRSSK